MVVLWSRLYKPLQGMARGRKMDLTREFINLARTQLKLASNLTLHCGSGLIFNPRWD